MDQGANNSLIELQGKAVTSVSSSANSATAGLLYLAPNLAPVADSSNTLAFTENGSASAADPNIQIADLDGTNLTDATVTISAGYTSADILSVATQNGISGIWNSSAGSLTLSGSATVANYQTALRSVTYSSSSDNPTATSASRTISWQVNDGSATNNISTAVTSTVNITAVNDAPVTGAGGNTLAYNENGAAAAINGSLTLTDADNSTLSSATVSITTGLSSSQDTLAFSNTNSSTFGNISASYNSSSGILTLTSSGATATVAQFQAALRAVTYVNSSDNPSTTNRIVSFQANDGSANSNITTSTITVAAVVDTLAPTATISLSASALKSGETATVTITFSEAPTNFCAGGSDG